ncbi:MAG: GNAT family N-acetyltransferase [Solirubrobacteraceae bacterium]
MSVEVTTTWLRLDALQPAGPPRIAGVEIGRVEPPDGAVSRWFYETVGSDYSWTDRSGHSDAEWAAWAASVETWVATVGGERAGYFELRPEGGRGVQIAYLGLLGAFHGVGLGGWLLTVALRRAQELGDPVWVHTCTLDGPGALPNYLARGMVPYRAETSRM